MLKTLKRVLPVALVLAIAVGMGYYMIATRKRPQRRKPRTTATLVTVKKALPTDEQIVVEATGTVIPSREVALQAEVSGRIIEVNKSVVPGGLLAEGEVIARIDPRNYQAALKQAEAQLADAQYSLAVEQGRQEVARREWEMAGSEDRAEANRSLVLRQPHLERLQALLASAQAGLEKARLDLERCTLRAPFNAMILEENVEIGQIAGQGTVVTLVGTDTYRIRVNIPAGDLRYVNLPDKDGGGGAAAKIIHVLGDGIQATWEGKAIKVLGDLEQQGRMARVLVEVHDPLGLRRNRKIPLLLGAFVRVELEGPVLHGVFALERGLVHEGNKVWIMDENDELEVRKVKVAWRREDDVLISEGLEHGDRVITSRLANAIPDLKLATGNNGNRGQ